MALIYHLARRREWEDAGASGPYRAASLAQEGFIHCSMDEDQMLAVANRLFAGMEDRATKSLRFSLPWFAT